MNKDKFIRIMEWVGCISGIIGALIVACNIGLVYIGYLVYIISTLSCLYVSIRMKQPGIMTMNIFFLLVNILGIIRWLPF